MKKLLTIIFLLLSFVVRAQQIDTVEYFFDKDPGLGKGTVVPIKYAKLDSTFKFTTGNLASGTHTLYVRLKSTGNKWSTLYQSTLLITNGIAGTAKITYAEYYYDKDPGYGKGQQIAINKPTIDSSLAFSVNGLATGQHAIYIRLKDNNNQWSTVYQGNFLVSAGTGATNFTQAEYYFDQDPGVGKGIQVLLNSTMLDSTFNFSVNGLAIGAHTIYIRLKNGDNNWSFPYQSNFVVNNGTAGTPQIKTLEYFVGDVKNAVNINLNPKSLIDTTISIHIPDNGSDDRIVGIQLKDQTGLSSNATVQDISLCYLYKPQGGFRTAQYASTFTLIDTSHFNTTNKVMWYENDVLKDSGVSINYQFPGGTASSEKIMQVTGTGCRVDTAIHTLNMPGIESYSPHEGSYNSDFTLTLFGAGLDSNLTITLVKGDTVLTPYLKYSTDNQKLLAIFDLHKMPLNTTGGVTEWDSYTLHVKYSNGYEYVGPGTIGMVKLYNKSVCNMYYEDLQRKLDAPPPNCHGCTVGQSVAEFIGKEYRCPPADAVNPSEPYFALDLSSNTSFRSNVWNTLNLSLTNTGNLVGKEIPVYVLVPANFQVDTSVWHIVGNYAKLQDSMSIIVPVIDTIINGKHIQYNMIGLMQPILGPGETQNITLRLRNNGVGDGDIYYWAAERYFGSPANLFLDPCASLAVDHVIGYIPVVGQMSAAWDWGWSIGAFITHAEFHLIYGDAWNPGQDLGSVALNSAGMLISAATAGVGDEGVGAVTKQNLSSLMKGMAANKTGTVITNAVGGTSSALISVANNSASDDPCDPLNQNGTPKNKPTHTVASLDPNHLYGNSDYDTLKNYINNYSPQAYMVTFENKPAATANAQHVLVTDTLNRNKFDLNTFKITRFTIADSTYNVPAYRTSATKDVAIKGRSDLKVRFAVNFDTASGILQADYFSIDAKGHVLPVTSLDGFLPPNKDGVSGTAGLSYSIYVRNLNTLDTFSNRASIYFDKNAPIVTNRWINTVDTTAPVTSIPKTIRVNDSTVRLILKHSDLGSGYWYSYMYAKKSTDTAFHRIAMVKGDTVIVKGKLNTTFSFYTSGTDNVNNQEKKNVADVTYTFQKALPVTFLSFNAVKTADSVRLNWQTASEINVLKYDVERSANAYDFIAIGTLNDLKHAEVNSYELYDAQPAPVNYYRIKEIDNDGKFTYSRIIRIDMANASSVFISPVPAHDYINIEGATQFDRVEFVDISGRVVKQFNNITGTRFNVSGLSAGTYFVRLVSKNNIQTQKIIKE